MTRATKHFLLSFLVLGLVLAAGSWTIHSTWFHARLLSFLRRTTGWSVSIRDSRLALLRGRIFLEGVEVHNPRDTMALQADHVRFDVSAFSIIRGKIIVTDFDIAQPSIALVKGGGPKTAIPTDILQRIFLRFERSLLLQSIHIEDATLTDLTLSIYEPGQDPKIGRLGKMVIGLKPDLLGRLSASLRIENSSGVFPSANKAELEVFLGRRGLTLQRFFLDTEKVDLALEGKFMGDFVRGTLKLSGSLDVTSVLSDRLTFELETDLKKRSVDVKAIKARLGQATFAASGEAIFTDPDNLKKIRYRLPFKAENLPLESIFGKMSSDILGPAKGLGSISGQLEGDLPALQARGAATIRNFQHGAMRAREINGSLDFHWPELDFEADIRPGTDGRRQGHAKGGVAFKHLPPFKKIKAQLKSVDVVFENGSVSDILPTLNVNGQLNGRLDLKGVAGSTSAEGTGHAEVTEGRWFLGPIDRFATDIQFKPGGRIVFAKTEYHAPGIESILWPDPVNLDSEDGIVNYSGHPMPGLYVEGTYATQTHVFRIEKMEFRRDGSNLSGSLTLRESGLMESQLKGTINLENLTAVPLLFRDMRGTARIDLSISGTTEDPRFKGWLEFQKNELGLRAFPLIEELEGRVVFEGTTVKPDVTGLLGDGRFHLGGSMDLKRYHPDRFNLTLRGTNLSYTRPNTYRIDMDTDLKLTGALPSPRLSGRIDIVDARYTKAFRLRELVLKPFEEETEEPAAWKKTLDPWELDLTVKHSGDLRIKNNIADLYLLADLQVDGTFGRPRIRGALTATEGEVRLFGDKFVLLEGRLEFIDPARKEPYLTIIAEEDLPPLYTVTVQLKGYLSNLEVDLSSTPSLPREDVLSLIATGHTQEELRQSGLNRQSLGLGVLAGEITSAIERPISRSTGLDVFRLEASESGQLSKVAVGKNVTDRLTLEFQSDFAPETAQQTLQANYYLTDNILLKGTRIWESGQSGAAPRYNINMSFRLRMQ